MKCVQTVLDFGQNLPGCRPCPLCGMIFSTVDKSDLKLHKKYHLSRTKGPILRICKKNSLNILKITEKAITIVVYENNSLQTNAFRFLFDLINRDLNCESDENFLRTPKKVFLAVQKGRVIGCCVSVPLKNAFRLRVDTNLCSKVNPNRVSIGIEKIWVCSEKRRTGIATLLLDTLRRYFFVGKKIDRSCIAFTKPTRDGLSFASKYTGTNEILVY